MKIGIVVNHSRRHAQETGERIKVFLEKNQVSCQVHDSFQLFQSGDLDQVDCVVTLGGDGTVLSVARQVAPLGIPLFPVNVGHFGFITEVGREDWHDDLLRLLDGSIEFYDRLMLSAQVIRQGALVFDARGLNDVVVAGAGISKLVSFDVNLTHGRLGSYRADGMIFATPTGSTAYSAAAGGPILHPTVEGMIVCPICPFTLSHRPIVIPATEHIRLRVWDEQRTNLALTVDGQIECALEPGDEVHVADAGCRARIAYSRKRNFYDVLRAKLNWSGGHDA